MSAADVTVRFAPTLELVRRGQVIAHADTLLATHVRGTTPPAPRCPGSSVAAVSWGMSPDRPDFTHSQSGPGRPRQPRAGPAAPDCRHNSADPSTVLICTWTPYLPFPIIGPYASPLRLEHPWYWLLGPKEISP